MSWCLSGRTLATLLAVLGLGGCFGSRAVQRSFYVLHAQKEPGPVDKKLRGMVRVRDLDAESVYEKFQIVIRNSPWELRYSGTNLWAVRPNVMIADILQSTLQDASVFHAVTRELTEARPDFTLGGDLQALEVYDSDDRWYAHLAINLRLTRFRDGKQLWRFDFDERKLVGSTEMPHAVRAMSELLQVAMRSAMVSLLDTVEGIEAPPAPGPAVGTFYEPGGKRPDRLEAASPDAGPVNASRHFSVEPEVKAKPSEDRRTDGRRESAPYIVRPSDRAPLGTEDEEE